MKIEFSFKKKKTEFGVSSIIPVIIGTYFYLIKPIQGEVIDNIAKNMQSTVEYVEQAKEETKKAIVYQTKARKVRI